MREERKYFVKRAWVFELESMDARLDCILYDWEDGKFDFPIEVAGTMCKDEADIYALQRECSDLVWIASHRKVTGREFGRIKCIAEWRRGVRYLNCINAGNHEGAKWVYAD